MNAVPIGDNGRVRTIWTGDGGLWIECRVTYPKSYARRTVDVLIDREQAITLMKDLKDSLIDARSKSMTETVEP